MKIYLSTIIYKSQECRKTSFFILRNLRHIRHHFTKSGFEMLIHAFVTSRIDYCNSLFTNIPKNSIKVLQSIQNYAARLVSGSNLRNHITPVLEELHWLPVVDRIDFKVLLITYKVVHLGIPLYLVSQIKFKKPTRNLRYYDDLLLEEPRSYSSKMGDRSFQFYAPKLWNNIPFEIRSAVSVDIILNHA